MFWYTCIYPELKGLLNGTSVSAFICMECRVGECRIKKNIFLDCFPELITSDATGFNRKIHELNSKLIKRKLGFSRLYCPRKTKPVTKCTGITKFCKFNILCNKIDISRDVIRLKSIRWRKGMVYVVKFRDGSIRTFNKDQFGQMNIDEVEIVYPGNLELQIVTELVPQGEEDKRLEDIMAAFTEKYEGFVVDGEGLHDFREWFQSSKSGSSAVIPEKALVPVKSFKISKIKGDDTEKKSKSSIKEEENLQPSIFENSKELEGTKTRKTGKTSK